MGRNAAWASFTGLTFALAAAGVTAQPTRSGLPPLPPELASKHALDERALQALRPPGPAPVKAGMATTPAPTELVKAPTAPKPASPPAMPPAAGTAPATPPARAAAPAQAPKMSLGLKSCKFEYKGKSTRLTLPHDTSEVSLEFKAEKGCLTAASSDQLWAEAAIRSFKQDVLVTLEPNPGVKPRTANLFVVAGDAPLEFTVTQEGKPAPVAAPAPAPTQAPAPALAPSPISTPVPGAPAPEASPVKVVEPAPVVTEAPAEKQEPPKAMPVELKNDAPAPTPEAPKEPMLEVKRDEQKAPEEAQPPTVTTPAPAEPATAPLAPAAGPAVEVKETKAPVLADVVPSEGKKEGAPAKAEDPKSEVLQAPKVEPVKKADEAAKPSEPVKEPAGPTPAITPIPSTPAVSGLPPLATPVSPGDDYEEVDLSDEPAGGSPA